MEDRQLTIFLLVSWLDRHRESGTIQLDTAKAMWDEKLYILYCTKYWCELKPFTWFAMWNNNKSIPLDYHSQSFHHMRPKREQIMSKSVSENKLKDCKHPRDRNQRHLLYLVTKTISWFIRINRHVQHLNIWTGKKCCHCR